MKRYDLFSLECTDSWDFEWRLLFKSEFRSWWLIRSLGVNRQIIFASLQRESGKFGLKAFIHWDMENVVQMQKRTE